jgi:nucleotide-binding universal stress UspA family protein
MYKNILIATDGSEIARKAMHDGLALARCLGARVSVVTVTGPRSEAALGETVFAPSVEDFNKICAQEAARILSEVDEAGAAAGVQCKVVHVGDKFPADGILETAEQLGCDLIVMGSHGRRGLAKFLLGSQATEVLTRAKVPVLICR